MTKKEIFSKTTANSSAKNLTKREFFAAMAMQGMLANTNVSYGASDAVFYTSDAVFWADKLIKALNESQP